MATHSSTLAWKILWTEEPGGLHTQLSVFTFMHWRRKWHPTPVFLPGESQGWGSLVAAVYGVAQSRTQLTRLSSSRKVMWKLDSFFSENTSVWWITGSLPLCLLWFSPYTLFDKFMLCDLVVFVSVLACVLMFYVYLL